MYIIKIYLFTNETNHLKDIKEILYIIVLSFLSPKIV